ncbi:hypothetical protein [Saccharopolyspora shandongensis]|uniref:hypothetical protein n=1 Tax=Saccharopolyspora shandongensis TaxID=418495 RepID=UPI0033CFBA4B
MSQRLLGVLPPVLVVPDGDGCTSIRGFLNSQIAASPPGRQVVLDRLLVCTLWGWFDRPESVPPSLFRVLGDAAIGSALRAMHAAPEKPWTLAALAREAGVSRTTPAGSPSWWAPRR